MFSRRHASPHPDRAFGIKPFYATVVVILALFGYLLWTGYRTSHREALVTVNNLAEVLATHIESDFDRAQSDLRVFAREMLASDLAGYPSAERRADFETRMGNHLRSFPAVVNYHVFDAAGRSVFGAGSANPHVPFDAADRAWFQQLRDDPARDIVVSDVLVSKIIPDEVILMALALRDSEGRFLGAVDASFRLAYFQRLIDRLDIGPKGLVSLRRSDDYRLVLRHPEMVELLNAPLQGASLADRILSGEARGEADFVSPVDHVPRSYAFRTLHQYPLSVIVAVAPDDYLAPWRKQSALSSVTALVLIATLTVLYRRQWGARRRLAERTAQLITEMEDRTRAEEALRDSRERHKRVTDSLFEGVIAVDRSGHLVFANPSARRLLQWDVDDAGIEGHPLNAVVRLRVHDHDVGFEESPWQTVISQNTTMRDDDAHFVLASGKTLAVAWACSPLPYADGRRAAILSFRDIETLKQAQREAIQASRMASVGQLAAGIAHEINTPAQYVGDNLRYLGSSLNELVAVVDTGHALAEQARTLPAIKPAAERFTAAATNLPLLTGEMSAAIGESLDGVAQIARIVLSIREFSHPGTGGKTATDINKALENTLTVSRNVWRHAAEIDRRLDPALPMVSCHAGEMNQVFLNLIVNAAQAIEASGKPLPGRITLTTRARRGAVEIRVSDTGSGIADDIREKVFDPFFTTKEAGKGTGLGLAICRDVVVAKHGGTISVGGQVGQGTDFVLTLPLGGDDAPMADDEIREKELA
jgi:PAS domain S-box-containing protein